MLTVSSVTLLASARKNFGGIVALVCHNYYAFTYVLQLVLVWRRAKRDASQVLYRKKVMKRSAMPFVSARFHVWVMKIAPKTVLHLLVLRYVIWDALRKEGMKQLVLHFANVFVSVEMIWTAENNALDLELLKSQNQLHVSLVYTAHCLPTQFQQHAQ